MTFPAAKTGIRDRRDLPVSSFTVAECSPHRRRSAAGITFKESPSTKRPVVASADQMQAPVVRTAGRGSNAPQHSAIFKPMNSQLKAQTWIHESYQSGTQVVKRYGDFAGAHFHIGHLADDTDGDGGRSDVGHELSGWLNGGDEPWWMELLSRTSPDTVLTPYGCSIRATGPMVDTATPPSWGCWMEDDTDDAKILRGLMADALEKRDRTIIPPNP